MGHLKLIAEESVRVQIDQKAPQAVTTKLLDLTVGKHHLTYVGGEQDVIVAANKVTTATIPTTYNQQLLSDGNKALQAGRLDLAQDYFDRLRTMEQRGRVSLSLLPDISLSRARLYEAQKDLPGALSEYSKLSDMAVWQKRPDLRNEWSKAMERLASTVGHAIVFQLSPSGKCERSDLHLLPGNQLITVGQGKDEVVRIQAGKTVTLDRCGK